MWSDLRGVYGGCDESVAVWVADVWDDFDRVWFGRVQEDDEVAAQLGLSFAGSILYLLVLVLLEFFLSGRREVLGGVTFLQLVYNLAARLCCFG